MLLMKMYLALLKVLDDGTLLKRYRKEICELKKQLTEASNVCFFSSGFSRSRATQLVTNLTECVHLDVYFFFIR